MRHGEVHPLHGRKFCLEISDVGDLSYSTNVDVNTASAPVGSVTLTPCPDCGVDISFLF